ncbi:MAG: hypothetical protein AAF085_02585 [Planctomycetota bacterium]
MGYDRADNPAISQANDNPAEQPTTPPSGAIPPDTGSADPLSPEHREQLGRARQLRAKLRRTTKVASFNAWSFAILGGLSLPLAILSPWSLLAAVLLGGLAWNEFRGRKQLLRLDPRGPKTLGTNQVICCTLIAGYCKLKIIATLTGPGIYATAIEKYPELADMLEPLEELMQLIMLATYAIVLIVGVGVQGLTAWYYFSRSKHLRAYLEQTPDWVRELDRVHAG